METASISITAAAWGRAKRTCGGARRATGPRAPPARGTARSGRPAEPRAHTCISRSGSTARRSARSQRWRSRRCSESFRSQGAWRRSRYHRSCNPPPNPTSIHRSSMLRGRAPSAGVAPGARRFCGSSRAIVGAVSRSQVTRRYVAWVRRHTLAIILAHVVLLAGALDLIAFHLPLYADFSYLLPQDVRAVRDLRRLEARVKANDIVLALITAPVADERAAAARDLADQLRTL